MIIFMLGPYRDIWVGQAEHEEVSQASWECWLEFFGWAFQEGLGTPQLFQGGWVVEV